MGEVACIKMTKGKNEAKKDGAPIIRKRRAPATVVDAVAEAAASAAKKTKHCGTNDGIHEIPGYMGSETVCDEIHNDYTDAARKGVRTNNSSIRSAVDLTSPRPTHSAQLQAEHSPTVSATPIGSRKGSAFVGIDKNETPVSVSVAVSQVLRAVLPGVEKRIKGAIRNDLREECAGVKDTIVQLEKKVVDLRDEVNQLNRQLEANPVTSKRSMKEEEADRLLVHFTSIFDRKVIQYGAERCVVGRTVIITDTSVELDFHDRVVLSIQSMMFSKLPEENKSVFHSKIGALYCALRRAIVKTSIVNVERDTFSKFIPVDGTSSSIPTTGARRTKSDTKIERPFWCAHKFVGKEQLDTVQTRLENVQSKDLKTKCKTASTLPNDELSIFAASKVFQSVTSWLTKARERAKKSIYEQLGFLFSNWSEIGLSGFEQDRIEFMWEKESNDIGFVYEDVPQAQVIRSDLCNEKSVQRYNSLQWSAMLDKNQHFIVHVAYKVEVRKEKERKTDRDDKKDNSDDDSTWKGSDVNNSDSTDADRRTMYRTFNLLDVALQFLAAYCNYKSTEDSLTLLACSQNSFKCVYSFACVLKNWVDEQVKQYKLHGPVVFQKATDDKNDHFLSGSNKDMNLMLHHLFPCQSKMIASLLTSCLFLTDEEYRDDCLSDTVRERFRCYQREKQMLANSSETNDETVDREVEDTDASYEENDIYDAVLNGVGELQDDADEDDEDDFTN